MSKTRLKVKLNYFQNVKYIDLKLNKILINETFIKQHGFRTRISIQSLIPTLNLLNFINTTIKIQEEPVDSSNK